MEYITVTEAAKKWGVSPRRVQKLCEEDRIPGTSRFSHLWMIPKNAKKPTDPRVQKDD